MGSFFILSLCSIHLKKQEICNKVQVETTISKGEGQKLKAGKVKHVTYEPKTKRGHETLCRQKLYTTNLIHTTMGINISSIG